MSVRSALSNFAPHPGVRLLLYNERVVEPPSNTNHDTEVYPSSLPLALIVLGICLSVFIISLDRGIITTAIPSIVIEFQYYSDIGWALVLGRAVQGLGSAGILTGSFVVGTHSVRLASRPILFAFVGVLYGTGALVGPMLGGVFSQLTTWRWCFYINLPIGAITFVSVFCFFDPRGSQKMPELGRQTSDLTSIGNSFFRRIKALDWIGNTLFTSACTFLFLALQWSQERSSDWSSARCIAIIVLSGAMFLSFGVWLWWQGDEALIPLHILRQRTVAVSCIAAFFIYGTLLIHTYYLPIWFQAIKDKTAIESGIATIPYMLINALFSLAAGVFVSKNGLFAPPAIAGCFIATIGAGLLATLQPNTTTATWAGFEALVSAGLGMAIQQGFSAVQATLPIHEVPIGTAAVVACQSAGGAIFVSVGNTLLQNHLFDANTANTIPGVNIRAVIELGATRFREFVPAESLPALLNLYNDALQAVFIAAVPLCGLALFCTLFMEWKSVREGESPHYEAQTASELEIGSIPGFSTPELGSDAPTLAHLAPRARARWNQRWKTPRTASKTPLSTLNVVPELNISEKTLAPFQIKHDGFLAGEMKEVEIQDEIGKAITV
ncbi:hypothetical protein LTR64_005625 [Lithohypha guttulata]|uniref:uncharacterized protein n=1 Tax=Lithohypha guttulata TaxID=1690604 RepID=UPI002DDE2254|nr:hypothetical protein LTR51_002581 [Lithohypha guttulata]